MSSTEVAGWEVVDGRREPVALVSYSDYLDPSSGEILYDKLPDEWHLWQELWRDPRAQRRELELCRRDPWRVLATWSWTFDQQDPEQPFKRFPRYPYLHSLTKAWVEGGNLLPEKPRAMLTSILFAYLIGIGVNNVNRYDAFTASAMSFLKERVDDGGEFSTYDSLFGKIRLWWMLLPPWMRAPLAFRKWRIENTANKRCYVTAETAGTKTGRGLQRHKFFIDEAGYAGPQSEAMIAAAKFACPRGLVINGTPMGRNNAQFRLRDEAEKAKAKGERPPIRVVKLRWYHHPRGRTCISCGSTRMTKTGGTFHVPRSKRKAEVKLAVLNRFRATLELQPLRAIPPKCKPTDGLHWDAETKRWSSPWYQHARGSMTESLAARELDVSYEESVEGRVFPVFRRAVFLQPDALFDVGSSHVWGWDFGVDDFTSIVMGQHRKQGAAATAQVYDRYELNNVGAEHYCRLFAWLTGEFHNVIHRDPETGQPYVVEDDTWLSKSDLEEMKAAWGRPGRYGGVRISHIGDPSGGNRGQMSLETAYSRFARGAIVQDRQGNERTVGRIYMNPSPRDIGVAERLQTVTWALEHARVTGLDRTCGPLAAAFEEYHRKTDASGRILPGKGPEHDWTSHSMDAFGYWALHVFGVQGGFIAAGWVPWLLPWLGPLAGALEGAQALLRVVGSRAWIAATRYELWPSPRPP